MSSLVDVYWNLHKDTFSVRAVDGPNKGKVIEYRDSVILRNARFHVGQLQRDRIAAGAPKMVHAWIRGTLVADKPRGLSLCPITYNPRRDLSFVKRHFHNEPVYSAAIVCCNTLPANADSPRPTPFVSAAGLNQKY